MGGFGDGLFGLGGLLPPPPPFPPAGLLGGLGGEEPDFLGGEGGLGGVPEGAALGSGSSAGFAALGLGGARLSIGGVIGFAGGPLGGVGIGGVPSFGAGLFGLPELAPHPFPPEELLGGFEVDESDFLGGVGGVLGAGTPAGSGVGLGGVFPPAPAASRLSIGGVIGFPGGPPGGVGIGGAPPFGAGLFGLPEFAPHPFPSEGLLGGFGVDGPAPLEPEEPDFLGGVGGAPESGGSPFPVGAPPAAPSRLNTTTFLPPPFSLRLVAAVNVGSARLDLVVSVLSPSPLLNAWCLFFLVLGGLAALVPPLLPSSGSVTPAGGFEGSFGLTFFGAPPLGLLVGGMGLVVGFAAPPVAPGVAAPDSVPSELAWMFITAHPNTTIKTS